MMDRDRIIADIKRIGRRRVEYHKRNAKKELCSLWITSKQLQQKKAYFDRKIGLLIEQLEMYPSRLDYLPLERKKGTVLFEDFRFLSYNGDKMGKVFQRDGHIYRGVYKESVPMFLKLWNSGLLQVLGENGYIPQTTITDFYTDEYPIIMEHAIVDMSTSKSWNKLMIKDACITMAIIRRVAASVGFTLHDGHLNNLTFHNGSAVFTDIGSIVEDKGQKTGYASALVFAGLYRLVFSGIGNTLLRRIQIYDEDNNALWISPMYYDDATFECYKALKAFKRYHLLHSSPLCNWIIFRLFDCYDERPEFIELIFGKAAGVATECASAMEDIEPAIMALEKLRLNITTAVDIGGTSGELPTVLYSRLGLKTLALEYDGARSDKAYERFCVTETPINTLVFHYLYGADDTTRDFVRSDIAVALDITHNLYAYQAWKLDSLLNSLSKMSNEYILVTFHPDARYDTEEFEKYFDDGFETVYRDEIKLSNNGVCGVLFVGRKRK